MSTTRALIMVALLALTADEVHDSFSTTARYS